MEKHRLTLNEARWLYTASGGPSDHEPEEWEKIREELEEIVNAPSDRAAGQTIQWWGCWDKRLTATAFAREVRSLWGKFDSLVNLAIQTLYENWPSFRKWWNSIKPPEAPDGWQGIPQEPFEEMVRAITRIISTMRNKWVSNQEPFDKILEKCIDETIKKNTSIKI